MDFLTDINSKLKWSTDTNNCNWKTNIYCFQFEEKKVNHRMSFETAFSENISEGFMNACFSIEALFNGFYWMETDCLRK